MLGKESKITRAVAWACSWSLETEPQGKWGYRDIRNVSLLGEGECSMGQRYRGGEGTCSYTAGWGGGSASTGWNHKNNKFSPKSLSYRKYPMNSRVMWWDAELRTQTWYCRPVAARPGCVSHELMYLILSRVVRTSRPLHHSRAEISCSIVKTRGHTSGWHEVQGTWAPRFLMQERYPVCLRKEHTELFIWHSRKVVGTCWVSSVSGLLKINRVKFSWEFNAFKFS